MTAPRTAYLDARDHDLTAQLEHAIRDRRTALVYGPTTRRTAIARALLTVEHATHRSLTCTREHDRWVIHR